MKEQSIGLALGMNEFESVLVVELLKSRYGGHIHRCLDAVDLSARAQLREFRAVLVDSSFPRLSSSIIDTVVAQGVPLVGVAHTARDHGVLTSLGVDDVVIVDSSDVPGCVATMEARLSSAGAVPSDPPKTVHKENVDGDAPGQLISVWGAPGSPGRTSTATTLAQVLAQGGDDALLLDADTTTHGLAAHLSLYDEPSGLIAAAHHAERGELDGAALCRLARQIEPNMRVLTGIPHIARRIELRQSGMKRLLSVARRHFDRVVVDVGHCVDDLTVDMRGDVLAPGALHTPGLCALSTAEVLVAVTGCEPNAVARMLSHLPAVRQLRAQATLVVVVNRVREPILVGASARAELRDFIEEQTGAHSVVMIEDDPIHDQAAARGLTPIEVSAKATSVVQATHIARIPA